VALIWLSSEARAQGSATNYVREHLLSPSFGDLVLVFTITKVSVALGLQFNILYTHISISFIRHSAMFQKCSLS